MKWHTIYFAQGDEAQPLLHQLTRTEGGTMYGATDGSIQDVATQLAQHDTGILPEATDGEPWGSRDDTAQAWVNGTMTKSPGLRSCTSGPTCSMMPMASWPVSEPC